MFFTRLFALVFAFIAIVFSAAFGWEIYISTALATVGTFWGLRGVVEEPAILESTKGKVLRLVRFAGYSDVVLGGTLVGLSVMLQGILAIKQDMGW